MLAILGALPVVGTMVQFIVGKVFDAKVAITTAKVGGDRDVAVKMLTSAAQTEHESTTRLGIIAANKLLVFMLIGFAIPLMAYEWKVYIWDAMLGWGSTDAVRGQVADWGNSIIWFLFGAPTVMGVSKMWFGRKE